MQIQRFREEHVQECFKMLEAQYCEEQKNVPALPPFDDYRKELGNRLLKIAQQNLGWVLLDGKRVIAMMAGYPVPEFFGSQDGVFVPAYAHLYNSSAGIDVLTELYSFCAAHWVKNRITSHVVNVFVHDRNALECYIKLGFGMRCVDAIRETRSLPGHARSPHIHLVDRTNIGVLAEIHRQHCQYYRQSPMFIPTADEDPIQDLLAWIDQPDRFIFAYMEQDRCLGYIRLQSAGESIFSSHASMMNITALFVLPEHRKKSIATALLNYAQVFLAQQGKARTGVDFESINPSGSRFWDRFFTPYSYSLARRIDERILNLISKE